MADGDYKKKDIENSFDFDDDLDMDFDDEFNPPPIKDDRSVISKTTSEFAKAGMGEIVKPENLSRMVRAALPKEIETVRSLADDTLTSVSRVYEDTKEKLRGPLKETKRSLRAMKSVFGKVLPDKIDKWLDGVLADEDSYGSIQESKEQMQENQIASVLAENFKWQAEQAQEDNIKEELRAATDTELSRKQALFLSRVAASTQRLNDYNEGVNLGYQRKMLEINYRQLFAQQGLYEETKLLRKEFLTELKSITHNTALPDLVKQKKTEVVKDMGFRRLVQFGQSSFNSQISKYFPKMGENFRNLVNQKVGSIKEFLDVISQTADAVAQANDPSMQFGEQQFDESDRDKLTKKISGFVGANVGQSILGAAGKKIGNWIGEREGVKKVTSRMKRFTESPEYAINQRIREGLIQNKAAEYLPDWLVDGTNDLFRSIAPGLREESGTVGFHSLNNINEIAEFDNRTKLSITDIIPGYLARILQSSEGIRVGTLPPLQVYSHERGGFITSDELATDINAKLLNNNDKQSLKQNAKNQAELIFGKAMDKDEEELWERAMIKRARRFESSDIKELMEADAFGSDIPQEVQDKWRQQIAERFGWDNDKRKVTKNDVETNELIAKIFETSLSMMRRLGSPLSGIQKLNEGGLFYTEALKNTGLVKEAENKHTISLDTYYDKLLTGDHKATEEARKHIQSGRSPVTVGSEPTSTFQPKGPVYEYSAGDNVYSNPRDLPDALGSLRDGIFTLRDILLSRHQNDGGSTQDQTVLEKLHAQDKEHREAQTTRIVEALNQHAKLFQLEFNGLGERMYQGFFNGLDALTSNMTRLVASVGQVQVDEAIIKRWEAFRQASRSNREKGVDFIGNKVKTLGDFAMKIPTKLKAGGSHIYSKGKDFTKFFYNQAKKPIAGIADLFSTKIREDIFVMRAGKLQRVLTYGKLVSGNYIDQATGKVLETFENIRGPVMEKTPDGKTLTNVLTEEDIQNGLFNEKGEKYSTNRFKGLGLKAFDFLKNKVNGFAEILNPINTAKRALNFALKTAKNTYGLILDDIFVGDETTPRIRKRAILNGEYQDFHGNILSPRHFENLSSDVYVKDPTAQTGRSLVLTLAEATEKGLFDSRGRPYKSLMGKIKSFLKKPWELAKAGVRRGEEAVKGLVNTVFNAGRFIKRGLTLDMYPKFIYELLAWKFGAPEHHQEALKGGSLFTLPAKLFKRVKDFFTRDKKETSLKEKMKSGYQNSSIRKTYEQAKAKVDALREKDFIRHARTEKGLKSLVEAGNRLRGIKVPTKEELRQKAAEARESLSAKKEQAKLKLKAKRDALKANAEALSNRLGGWREALKRNKDKPKKTLKERFKETKEGFGKLIAGAVASIGMTLFKLYKWAKEGFGLPKLLKGIIDTTASIGTGIGKLAGVLGKGLVGAGKLAANVAVGAGRVVGAAAGAIASGAGGLIAGTASAVGSGLAAAGAFLVTNPVGWAILGITAGVAIWQFFKDDFEPLDRFRLLAYGLIPEDNKDQANKLLAFEKEVYKETRFDATGKPTLDEIDYQKWAGLFWDESAGQPTQDAWVAHVQKFERWFNQRFRPTYMKHVTALKTVDPKIEPYDMDDDLDDALKPNFIRRAFFDKKDLGQVPYDFMESPFTDVKVLTANSADVQRQRDTVLAKYGEDEKKLRERAEGKKDWIDKITPDFILSWTGRTQEDAKKQLAFEQKDQYKDMSAKVADKTKTGKEKLIGSLTAVELKDKDGNSKTMTLEESGYKIPESTNEFEFLNLMMLGMSDEVDKADYELLKEVEYQVSLKLVKDGRGWKFNGEKEELITKFITNFGWNEKDNNDLEAFGNWVVRRLIPYVEKKKECAIAINKNVDYPMMAQTLEFDELYKIISRLTQYTIPIPNMGQVTFLNNPYRPFKHNQAKPNLETFTKWLNALKARKGKNLFKTLTDEEKDAQRKKFAEGARREQERRERIQKTVLQEYDDARSKRNEKYLDKNQVFHTFDTSSHGYGAGESRTRIDVGSGPIYDYTMEATNDIRGIDWQQKGEFQPHNTKGAAEHNWEIVKDLFAQVSKVIGVDPGILARMAYQESKFDNNAGAATSSAKGMFQFIDSTWADYARKLSTKFGIQGANIRNPVHNALAGAMFLKDNLEAIKSEVKSANLPLDTTAAYSAHFMGTGGAKKFFKAIAANPDTPISQVLEGKALTANRSLAERKGGGWKTVAEFYNTLREKMENRQSAEFEKESRQLAGATAKQVSDADYGQMHANPNYVSDMNVTVGSGSPASGSYDIRDMKGSIEAAKQNGTSIAVRPGNMTTYGPQDMVQTTQGESANLKSKASVSGSGISHGSLSQEGKRLGTSYIANAKEGYDGSTEYFKRQPQSTDNGKPADTDNLDPNVRENLNRLAYDYKLQTGKELTVTTAYRSTEQQTKLYNSKNYKAAVPGTSLHEYGVAFDINPAQAEEAERIGLLGKYGFHRPLANDNKEKQHVQPTSVEKVPAFAKLAKVGDTGNGAPEVERQAEQMGGPRDIQFASSTLAGSGVMGSDFNPQAVSSQPSMARPTYQGSQPVPEQTPVTQTSIQQVMNQTAPSSVQQTQQQQAAMLKEDRALVNSLEEVAKKQLDVLLSIDTKFDKVIEHMANNASRDTAPVGSPRQQVQEIPQDVPKGPVSTTRPRARM